MNIGFASLATASGRSATTAYHGSASDGSTPCSQGAAHELRTGIDANGTAPDIEIVIGIGIGIGIDGYLQNERWRPTAARYR